MRVSSFKIKFGRNLARIAERKGISQTEISRRVGIGRTSITNIEAGRQNAGIDLICEIARAINCKPADLFKGID